MSLISFCMNCGVVDGTAGPIALAHQLHATSAMAMPSAATRQAYPSQDRVRISSFATVRYAISLS